MLTILGLVNYYRDHVIGGPGAFVMVAENLDSFGQAIIRKLITEIAVAPPWSVIASRGSKADSFR